MAFCLSPSEVNPNIIMASVGVGKVPSKAAAGPSLSGPTEIFPAFIRTALSPPIPIDFVYNPRINVFCPPIVTPDISRRGTPSAKTEISVVVPPISRATASSLMPAIANTPIMLAAGPECIVSAE